MTSNWFTLPTKGAGTQTDLTQLDELDHGLNGWSGLINGGEWVGRVYADVETLDSLARQSETTRHEGVPVKRLNQISGKNRTADEWRQTLRVGGDSNG